VTVGSSGNMDRMAFLNDPAFMKYKIVITGDSQSELKGPNIIKRNFINHLSILPKINIVICHGGNGTIYQALSFGVPILCIPNNFKNEWNADRIEELGLGTFIDDISDAEHIEGLIESWRSKTKYLN